MSLVEEQGRLVYPSVLRESRRSSYPNRPVTNTNIHYIKIFCIKLKFEYSDPLENIFLSYMLPFVCLIKPCQV